MSGNFDYIIIGGGSAGCVLANRLSADGQSRVCLVEAGSHDKSLFITIPLGIVMALRSKKFNWHFFTKRQSTCGNRKIYWPRGRGLGGSSSINAMCYVRGNAYDYDHWAALGNEGWSYEDVLPYFKKLENFEEGENHFHGINGPINVTSPRDPNPLMQAFIEAGKQAGYKELKDFNGEDQEGIGYFHITQKDGERFSNARAYLRAAEKRKNLTIITKAHVAKILFEGKRAIGVRYLQKGKSIDIFCQKEVILSAGAIGSPQLLLLSGIGPRHEIEKHSIPLVHELAGVGENLQDHLDIHITCLEKTHHAISFHPRAWWLFFVDTFHYFFKRRGCLTSNYTQAGGFIKTAEDLPAPNIQWHFAPSVYTHSARKLKNMFRYYGYTLMTCLLNPASHGKIILKNSDPLSAPEIDPNYLAERLDLDAMITGFKRARELLAQPAFNPHFVREFEPGDAIKADEQIAEYIRAHAETVYHPVGTCKMGHGPMAVVDPKTLKVYGVQNLRVIDASIMPTLIRGNTNAPTTMIAEKGADMILHDKQEHEYEKHSPRNCKTTITN